jgi:mono/diheme cytochrome c family protein
MEAPMTRMAFVMIGFVAIATSVAEAKGLGNPQDGLNVARQLCSECHAVDRAQIRSPHERAPTFQTVANAPGMNATELRVWFESAHPSMPNLVLVEKDSADLIAYILSLKRRN